MTALRREEPKAINPVPYISRAQLNISTKSAAQHQLKHKIPIFHCNLENLNPQERTYSCQPNPELKTAEHAFQNEFVQVLTSSEQLEHMHQLNNSPCAPQIPLPPSLYAATQGQAPNITPIPGSKNPACWQAEQFRPLPYAALIYRCAALKRNIQAGMKT